MANGSKSAVWADLRGVLAGRDFRRLLATRLISQAGDGVVTAGVGTYVFFNATTVPSPAAGAAAFAVLYLPYSLIGPPMPRSLAILQARSASMMTPAEFGESHTSSLYSRLSGTSPKERPSRRT